MGFLDKIKEMLGQHDDRVDPALDKAGDAAKARFAGQAGLIDGLVDKAKAATGQGDTTATEENPAEEAPSEPAPASEGDASPQAGDPPGSGSGPTTPATIPAGIRR
jgi:hypothetical protein